MMGEFRVWTSPIVFEIRKNSSSLTDLDFAAAHIAPQNNGHAAN